MGIGIIAIVIGYLLGSIPSAYIAARVAAGKDIRRLGGGNVGGLNLYREVGALPAVVAGIADVLKGTAAVAIAYWLLEVDKPYVLAAAVAVVVGHNWMLFLKFSGGKGMGATIGALFVLFPIYDYAVGLAFFFAVVIIVFIITRNVAMGMGLGIVTVPFIAWLGMGDKDFLIFSLVLAFVIAIKFFPTAKDVWVKVGGLRRFIFYRGHKYERK
jgi:glycerol-3-phosphate acyltransferase PlsY